MMEIVIMNIKEKKDEWQTAIRENALGDKTKKAKDNIREENYNKIFNTLTNQTSAARISGLSEGRVAGINA